MPLTPAYSLAQSPIYPNIVVAVNQATGTDVAVTQLRIYIQNAQGQYLVPSGVTTDYTPWPLASVTINLDILTQDTAVQSTVQWLDVSNNVLYELSQTFCFALYNQQFAYQLIQGLTPPITLNTNYSNSLANLWTSIRGAINAIEVASDVAASQNCLNQGTYLRTNQSLFF